MKDLIDYDPLTRTSTWHHYDPVTDVTTIEEVQDVEPYLERAKQLRNNEGYTRNGIKGDLWHYATLPNGVISQMMQKGVNPFNKAQSKEVLRLINTEYPWLKTTRGKHSC